MMTPEQIADAMEIQRGGVCPICGETAPEPRWLCIPRWFGQAVKGEPCSYSLEGHERISATLDAGRAALAQEADDGR